jgi:hypothetical protein
VPGLLRGLCTPDVFLGINYRHSYLTPALVSTASLSSQRPAQKNSGRGKVLGNCDAVKSDTSVGHEVRS